MCIGLREGCYKGSIRFGVQDLGFVGTFLGFWAGYRCMAQVQGVRCFGLVGFGVSGCVLSLLFS